MLRLAALLNADDPENIVAEAYYQLYPKWRKLRATDSAEAYPRSVVLIGLWVPNQAPPPTM